MSTQPIGGWSNWNFKVEDDVRKAFEAAMDGTLGVNYGPIFAYSSRPTSVNNYAFLVKATMVNPGELTNLAKVNISSLSGKSEVYSIEYEQPEADGGPGSWSSWEFYTNDSSGGKKFIGFEYESLGHTSRTSTDRKETAYFAKETVVSPQQPTRAAILMEVDGNLVTIRPIHP